ncbi:protein D1-like [Pieris brassicae]|uniref:protein D1-like n=1 Tax=Pieris brassicae TaxID=7116 RepID=UPI001E65FBBC|nr:protein D1-like [Pieris brassicae]
MPLFVLILGIVGAQAQCYNDCSCIPGRLETPKSQFSVPDAFHNFNITPNYLPVPPQEFMEAPFSSVDVNLGAFISPLRTIDLDTFSFENGNVDKLYTLILIDIDSPTNLPRHYRGFVNLLAMNLPSTLDFCSGHIIVPFTPVSPEIGTGLHRIIELVYEQERPINIEDINLYRLARSRIITRIGDFAETYRLGNPLAGNFFTTQLSYCNN